ncbi:hypothetical protein EVAR_22939_1 [Eumeta japonica]|uniref:Uncharacterized protein n=1 Tax=Eumeta variegata TaxID=151549 RepID=A0A4C1UVJ2_EUMVA|nr:hypothetical protein EVAR_22939_1 [Eumeta japonica]
MSASAHARASQKCKSRLSLERGVTGYAQVLQYPATSCVRPLSLFYSNASADGVEKRLLVPRSHSHARLRRNATMSHAFLCVQPAFIDL